MKNIDTIKMKQNKNHLKSIICIIFLGCIALAFVVMDFYIASHLIELVTTTKEEKIEKYFYEKDNTEDIEEIIKSDDTVQTDNILIRISFIIMFVTTFILSFIAEYGDELGLREHNPNESDRE